MEAKHFYDIHHNVKIKAFPLAEQQKMTVCNKAIFRESGWEQQGQKSWYQLWKEERQAAWDAMTDWERAGFFEIDEDGNPIPKEEPKKTKPQNPNNESRGDSVRRAKQKIFEMTLLNPFTHFITWTLDKEKIDRYSVEETKKAIANFLRNMARRHGLRYIIIPEFHKDGAIHFHGLISGNIELIDSGKKTKRGQAVYNMPQWKYGWSTAIELDGNVQAIARYITKYITKDFQKIFGNFYYAGGDIIRNPDITLTDTEYEAIEAPEYVIHAAKRGYKYLDVTPSNPEDFEDFPDDYFEIA